MNDFDSYAISYFKAAKKLSSGLPIENDLYDPCMFLLRHAVELKLKSLILNAGGVVQPYHSLSRLWDLFKKVDNENLIPYLTAEESKQIESLLKHLKKVNEADRYRYPVNKENKSLKSNKIKISDNGVVHDINDVVVESDGEMFVMSKQSVDSIKKLFNLFELADVLFKN